MIRKMLGYVKVTKASKQDKELTITVNRLSKLLTPVTAYKFKQAAKSSEYRFVIDIDGFPTVFHPSRNGTTLYSRHVHPNIIKPEVGRAIYLYVSTLRVEKF